MPTGQRAYPGRGGAGRNAEAAVVAILASIGYDVVDCETPNRGRLLRVFIDHAGATAPTTDGITLEDCERASRQLQLALAVEGIEYDRLEVSSPGLDRVLKRPADFRRFAGCEAELRLRVPREGRRRFTGPIGAVSDDGVEIAVQGASMKVGWADLERARLVPRL